MSQRSDRMSILESIIQSKIEWDFREHFKKIKFLHILEVKVWTVIDIRRVHRRATNAAQFFIFSTIAFPTKSIKKFRTKSELHASCINIVSNVRHTWKAHRDCQYIFLFFPFYIPPLDDTYTVDLNSINIRSFLFVKFENFVKLEFFHSRSSVVVGMHFQCLT